MKEIKLSQEGKNRGKFVALVDDEDYDFLNQWPWYAANYGCTYYAQRHMYNNGVDKIVSLHRIIMNTPIGMEVDHVDHNGLNCQKFNMRNCIHQQNGRNRKSYGRCKYLGVSYLGGKYIRAYIRVNGKLIHLGYYKTEEEAATAYDKAAKIHHKEFANLNFKS